MRAGGTTSSSERGFSGVNRDAGPLAAPLAFSEDELALRFTERLRFFAARRLNDATAAEDVAQETMRLVLEAIRANRVDNIEALPGFVFQTARNVCMHWVRSTAREKSAFARFERESVDGTGRSDVLEDLISAERAQAVKRALDRLAFEDRRLLSMIYYDGLDTEEIAARLGINTSTTRVRKHRALQRLAAELSI